MSRLRKAVRNRGLRTVVLPLGLGVLLPAACVVWFMTEAAGNQADAARQRLSEALRGQLELLRDRIESDWQARMAELAREPGTEPRDFRRAVTSGNADSIVFFDGHGSFAYPTRGAPAGDGARQVGPPWRHARALEASGSHSAAAAEYAAIAAGEQDGTRAARAAQGHVRNLVRTGNVAAALRAIDVWFTSGRAGQARDRHGRLIAADAHLLALQLLVPSDERARGRTERLAALLNDYEGTSMPSAQRLFLMGELQRLAGGHVSLPTYEAERLAAAFLEADGLRPAGDALEAARVPGLWKLAVGDAAVALFRTDTITALANVAPQHAAGSVARFELIPPGRSGGTDTIAAGRLLPGWLVGFSLVDADGLERAAGQRMTLYLWTGSAAIAGLAIAGLLLWQAFRRQGQVNRLKTDLVAAVSHELKTPLASMRALVDLMLDKPDIDRRVAREYLEMMAGQNARLSGLIEHFLAFARADRNRPRFEFRTVDPALLMRQVVAAVPGADRFPGLVVDVASGLPPLSGDEDALATVLLNLLENAYKYTGAEKHVSLRAFQEGPHVVFEVQDNGIGIDRRERARIFQPFYQVDRRLARESGGCGLGLSIVDFIVRAHGGQVSVQSDPGSGSLFRVVLPARISGRRAVA